MGKLKKIDHLTYAVSDIRKWAWYYIEKMGGRLITKIDDVQPQNPRSSMKLWCIQFDTFGIALVEGIDRLEKSQVSLFVHRHGDHSLQHVAYDVGNIKLFLDEMGSSLRLRGEVLTRNDGFGIVKQTFGKGYESMSDVAEMGFPEFVERPHIPNASETNVTFSENFGRKFYEQIEDARNQNDQETLLDFSDMSNDWEPPQIGKEI